jgi:CheY-like chemotaxis protein
MVPRKSSTHAVPVRILLVDDNAQGLKARKQVLEELGYQITIASGGDDALELFAKQKFDLVVTDYKMPHMDGIELIARLRKNAADLRIILISGYVDALGLSEQNTNADAVIQKSANEVTHLIRAVARILRQRKPASSAGSKVGQGRALPKTS